MTPLHLACAKGHLDVAQWLHSVSASVNATNIEGETPLHLACAKGHLEIAQWLQSAGASVNATSNVGNTPLHRACTRGHLAIAHWLLSVGASVNAANIGGCTPLHDACFDGRLGIAQWLCSVGADATLRINCGDTPAQLLQRPGRTAQLDQQALRGTLACLVQRAQAQGPLPCTTPSVPAFELTPPCLAGAEAEGAQATSSAASSSSAGDGADERLFEAGDLAAAQAAVADGTNVSARNAHVTRHAYALREDPLHRACLDGRLDVAQWLHSAPGAPVNETNSKGETPLYLACSKGHLDVAQWLHSVGTSVSATATEGMTPLHVACLNGHLDVAQWLHSAGASLNTTNIGGCTPLHHACATGRLGMISWLCSAGADATLMTSRGYTTVHLLQRREPRILDKQAFRSTMDALFAAERRGAEERARAAEVALLGEEAVPPAAASKAKAKAKSKARARAQDGPAPAQSAVGSSSDFLPPSSPPSDAADAALRVAMDARNLEVLKATINQTTSMASDAVLKEARALREQLKERELKAKKQLRREAEAARVHEAREAPARHAL